MDLSQHVVSILIVVLLSSSSFSSCSLFNFTFVDLPHNVTLPLPTPQQLKYQGQMSALIHFGMATYFHDGDPGCTAVNWNGCEVGVDGVEACNSHDVNSFRPDKLNVSNWIDSFNDLGLTSAVLTAKHGCGFLGWQTATVLPSGLPYSYHVPAAYPVVDLFVSSLRAAGFGVGFYYSLTNNFYLNVQGHVVNDPSTLLPNQVNVTQSQFEDIAIAQVRELWNNYGELTEVWLDGGCGSICDRVAAELSNSKAKNAVAWNGGGGTSKHPIRWCGTESGHPSGVNEVWSTASCGFCPNGSGSGDAPDTPGAEWNPSGVDVTLQTSDRWFFTPGASLHSVSELASFYHDSVGANGHLELDFAIDREGRVDDAHAQRYREFGQWIRDCYGQDNVVAKQQTTQGETSISLDLTNVKKTTIDRISLEEDQSSGQLIISWVLSGIYPNSSIVELTAGNTVGSRRIAMFNDGPIDSDSLTELRLDVTKGYDKPKGLTATVYGAAGCQLPS